MDENAYRRVLSTSIARPCPFEKTILTRCAACALAEKHNVAEREVVACSNELSFERCVALHDALRHNFAFALHKHHIDGPLPHAQEMRIQCGGLRALQFMLDDIGEVSDVVALVVQAHQEFGSLDDYPYSKIVQLANGFYKSR